MAKTVGRNAVISLAGTPLAGVRVSGFKSGAEFIDVTDKDSNGFTEFLAAVASRGLEISVEGIYSSPVLRDIHADPVASLMLTNLTFKFADALAAKDTIAGNFVFQSYEESNPHDDGSTFTASFASSGLWTYS